MWLLGGHELAQAVAAWRADAEEVGRALVRERVPAALGPRSSGWTLVRLLVEGQQVLEPRSRSVVDLVDDLARTLGVPGAACLPGDWGARTLVVCTGTGLPLPADVPAVTDDRPADRAAWAELLRALGRLDRLEPALAVLAAPAVTRSERVAAVMTDTRARRLAAGLGLPAGLLDPLLLADDGVPREAVVLRRLAEADEEPVLGALGLPLRVARLDRTVLVAPEALDGQALLPLASAVGWARQSVLLLWRQGAVRGFSVVRRGTVQDSHAWGAPWECVDLDPELDEEPRAGLLALLSPPQADAAALVERFAAEPSQVDVVQLRALLRAAPTDATLGQLCLALQLDPRSADVVEGRTEPAALPGRTVRPTPPAAAIWRAAMTPHADDPWLMRVSHAKPWWWRLLDVLWAVLVGWWVTRLWPDGGLAARSLAAVLVLSAVWGLWDAVTPARTLREEAGD